MNKVKATLTVEIRYENDSGMTHDQIVQEIQHTLDRLLNRGELGSDSLIVEEWDREIDVVKIHD